MKIILVLPLLLIGLASARLGLRPDGKLDINYLRETYQDGEVETVRNVLESYRKKRENVADMEEKIFLYKYLGVIYAADSLERNKAENCFNQLLVLSPSIELTDMYASTKIQSIFQEVKQEYLRNREYQSHFDAFGHPLTVPAPDSTAKAATAKDSTQSSNQTAAVFEAPKHNRKWLWWGAGLAAAAVGTGVVLWVAQEDPKASPGSHYEGGF